MAERKTTSESGRAEGRQAGRGWGPPHQGGQEHRAGRPRRDHGHGRLRSRDRGRDAPARPSGHARPGAAHVVRLPRIRQVVLPRPRPSSPPARSSSTAKLRCSPNSWTPVA